MPGESHGQRSLVSYNPWGHKELDTTEHTILDAWGWCTGTTQRDGVGREDGGGFRMGRVCIPVADLF